MTERIYPRTGNRPEIKWSPTVGLLLRWPSTDWYVVQAGPSMAPYGTELPDDAEDIS